MIGGRALTSVLFTGVLLCTANPAGATVSSIALGRSPLVTMGLDVTLRQGTRPTFLPGERTFQQLAVGFRSRGGWADETTDFGTQIGVEYELFLGWVSKESAAIDPESEAGFSFRLGLPLRILTFNLPVPSMVVVHLSAEIAAGNALWWSNTVRLNVMGGLRWACEVNDSFGIELDYTAVPFTLTGSSHNLYIDRFAHRIRLSGGYGTVGLAVQLLLTNDRVRSGKRGPIQYTGDQALSLIAEWRLGE